MQLDLNKYVAGLLEVPTGVKNLADIIAFNTAHANEELVPPFWTDQSMWANLFAGEIEKHLTEPQIRRFSEYHSQSRFL